MNSARRTSTGLDGLTSQLLSAFEAAGYARVSPDILQPASLFFDRVGEDIRERTYVFTDPDGTELCLRPDLTLPVCRLHLEREPGGGAARYAYAGPAFRFQAAGRQPPRPREFPQAGLENIGAPDRDAADLDVIRLTHAAVAGSGCRGFLLRLGDIAVFDAVLGAIDMPQRWRRRLHQAFWRPVRLTALLKRLVVGEAIASASGFGGLSAAAATARLQDVWQLRGIEPLGARTAGEIAARLQERAADADAPPLDPQMARLIAGYAAISGVARTTLDTIARHLRQAGLDIDATLDAQAARLDRLADAGLPIDAAIFDAGFGRQFAYYTGLVFQFEPPGSVIPLAGGGRYDTLIGDMGGAPSPAVGAAVHTERLLEARA